MFRNISMAMAVLSVSSIGILAQGGPKPTDPQIAHIAYTAGQLDIAAGEQALKISKNQEVRAFAEQMVKDHTAVNNGLLFDLGEQYIAIGHGREPSARSSDTITSR